VKKARKPSSDFRVFQKTALGLLKKNRERRDNSLSSLEIKEKSVLCDKSTRELLRKEVIGGGGVIQGD